MLENVESMFNAMQICKTWLRAQTQGYQLNNIIFWNNETLLMDDIKFEIVAMDFGWKMNKKQAFFLKR